MVMAVGLQKLTSKQFEAVSKAQSHLDDCQRVVDVYNELISESQSNIDYYNTCISNNQSSIENNNSLINDYRSR